MIAHIEADFVLIKGKVVRRNDVQTTTPSIQAFLDEPDERYVLK
jgi:hypothetical protein